MKRLLPFLFLLALTFGAEAASRISATITVTNTPANADTLVVNGNTRTWVTQPVATPGSQVGVTNNAPNSATNLWLHILATPFAGPITIQMSGATNIVLLGAIDQAMALSSAGTWCSIAYATQTVSTLYTVRVPGSSEPTTVRTNNFTLLTTALGDYPILPLNEFTHFGSNFVGRTSTQTVSGPKLINSASSRWMNGELTNAELKSVRIRYDDTNANGIYFYSGAAGRISAIAPDVNGLPSIYGTITLEQPTNGLAFTPAYNNILTWGGGTNDFGAKAYHNVWTHQNQFNYLTNSTVYNENFPKTTSSTIGVLNMGGVRFLHSMASSNVFLGENAGNFTLTGISNTVVGARGGVALTTGSENSLLGFKAGTAITTGNYNTAIGGWAFEGLMTGDHNTGVGDTTSLNSSSVSRATVIGSQATANTDSVSLGYGAISQSYTNSIAIGKGAVTTAANTAALGGVGTYGVRLNVNAGQGASFRAWVGGNIWTSTTATGNGAGVETDLFSLTLEANVLARDGEVIEFWAAGTYANNANGKTINVKCGSTTIFTTGSLAINGGDDWSMHCRIIRAGASSLKCVTTMTATDTLLTQALSTDYATASESTGSTIQLRITGNGAGASDVVGEMAGMKWLAAP